MSEPIDIAIDDVLKPVPPDEIEKGDGTLPYVTHAGEMPVGNMTIRVFRLSDGRRIVDADDLQAFFGFLKGADGEN